jgi:hypothetical protein
MNGMKQGASKRNLMKRMKRERKESGNIALIANYLTEMEFIYRIQMLHTLNWELLLEGEENIDIDKLESLIKMVRLCEI